ncbi:MAG: hypothetical protein FWE12_03715 [Oscillospiraceae bacterium]|nr:hypothetical protein [Oscillospiraceae bacterium]
MKKILLVVLVIALALSATGCAGDEPIAATPEPVAIEPTPDAVSGASTNTHPLEAWWRVLTTPRPFFTVDAWVDHAIYEDGWIIFCFFPRAVDLYSTLHVEWVTLEGIRGEQLEIPWPFPGGSRIVGFDLTEENHFQFLIQNRGLEVLFHVVYDRQGNLVAEPRAMLDLAVEEIHWFSEIAFLPSGDILVPAMTEEDGMRLYILTPDGRTLREEWPIFGDLAITQDGRILGLARGFWEFDPITRRFAEIPTPPGADAPDSDTWRGILLYPAPAGSAFDVYVEHLRPGDRQNDHDWWLYGYQLDSGTFVPHMPWAGTRTARQVIPLPDGRFVVMIEQGWRTEFFMRTP